MPKKYDKKPQESKSEDNGAVVAEDHKDSASHEHVPAGPEQADTPPRNPWVHLYRWALVNKKISIPAVAVLLVVLLAVVPFTRYAFAGLLVKQSFPLIILDDETGKPVSSATVSLNGQKAETDGSGQASVRTKVGYGKLTVSKKYYKGHSQTVLVTLQKPDSPLAIRIKADGRPVSVTIINHISKKPIANALVAASDTRAKTDTDGKAIIVVPEGKKEMEVKLSAQGFNTLTAKLTVTTEETDANTFSLAPSGKIYYLSNASGTIDLVKSNLDGSERQTVLAGTGKEDRNNTQLLATRDWKYIALLTRRDGGDYVKLFLIETDTGKVTNIDEGNANFNPVGWSGNRFIYTVYRQIPLWQPKRIALKSYYAPNKKLTTLAETTTDGGSVSFAHQLFSNIYILNQQVLYLLNWEGSTYYLQNKQATLYGVNADGSQTKIIKSYPSPSASVNTGNFGELYIRYYQNDQDEFDEYEDGKISPAPSFTNDDFWSGDYSVYSVSPSGQKTLWSENRDGKNAFFVGDSKGENSKEIGRSDEFSVYGWFTDDYILLTRKGSEMYILPADGLDGGVEKSAKISDYYKPNSYYNNGFGYGGYGR